MQGEYEAKEVLIMQPTLVKIQMQQEVNTELNIVAKMTFEFCLCRS